MADTFANASQTTLNGSIDSSQTSITVTSASTFPTTAPYRIRVRAEGANTHEIMTVIGGAGTTTWTVVRASEPYAGSSSTSAHGNGAIVEHVLTAGVMQSLTGLAGLKKTEIGRTTVGGSYFDMGGGYAKKFIAPSDGLLVNIAGYVKGNSSNAAALHCFVLSDNAGTPYRVIASNTFLDNNAFLLSEYIDTNGRWISKPINAWLTGGTTYWMVWAMGRSNGGTQLAYDSTGGSDWNHSGSYASDHATQSYSSTSHDYSIKGTFIEASATTSLTTSKQLLGSDTALNNDAAWHDLLTASLPAGKYIALGAIQVKTTGGADAFVYWRVTDGTNHIAGNTAYSPAPYNPQYGSAPVTCPEFTLTATTTMKLQYATGATNVSALRYEGLGTAPGTYIEFIQLPEFMPTPAGVSSTTKGLWFGLDPRANSTLNSNEAHYARITIPISITPNRIGITIHVSSGNLDLGVYTDDGTGLNPGTKIASLGSTASPGTGTRTFTLSPGLLSPGVYWLAFACDNGTLSVGYSAPGTGNGGGGPLKCLRQSSAFPLPSTAGGSLSQSSWTASVWVEVN